MNFMAQFTNYVLVLCVIDEIVINPMTRPQEYPGIATEKNIRVDNPQEQGSFSRPGGKDI